LLSVGLVRAGALRFGDIGLGTKPALIEEELRK
jgi:hypothetical protein